MGDLMRKRRANGGAERSVTETDTLVPRNSADDKKRISLCNTKTIVGVVFLSIFLGAAFVVAPLLPNHRALTKSPLVKGNEGCRYFLAESAIPHGGLGLFTAIDIAKEEAAQPMKDICVYVTETPPGTQFETHSWAQDVFNGIWEGQGARALCEGFATLFNSMPPNVATSKMTPQRVNTNAGLTRDKFPGAGAITHFYGIGSKALRQVPAGSEITIDYGDFEYEKGKNYIAPTRDVDWLLENGMCIDNIRIGQASDPQMGRGAFASRSLQSGQLVSPAPLQTYLRSAFEQNGKESLLVNYCFQPQDSDIMLFPYGPGVNLINHSLKPNVELRWSTNPYHKSGYLDLDVADYMKLTKPGSLILDLVALREIDEGEELFLNYGVAWQKAWDQHLKNWKPSRNSKAYVYPEDVDNKLPLKTVQEEPVPSNNLVTICWTDNWDREKGSTMEWKRPTTYDWPEGTTYCHILERNDETKEYTVALDFHSTPRPYNPDQPHYIDTKVAREAISWVEPPYTSDMHLPNAFRYPIALPPNLSPEKWMVKG